MLLSTFIIQRRCLQERRGQMSPRPRQEPMKNQAFMNGHCAIDFWGIQNRKKSPILRRGVSCCRSCWTCQFWETSNAISFYGLSWKPSWKGASRMIKNHYKWLCVGLLCCVNLLAHVWWRIVMMFENMAGFCRKKEWVVFFVVCMWVSYQRYVADIFPPWNRKTRKTVALPILFMADQKKIGPYQ